MYSMYNVHIQISYIHIPKRRYIIVRNILSTAYCLYVLMHRM